MDLEKKFQMHKELLENCHNTYIAKNKDYGDSVHETYKRYGLISFLVRIEDKLNRARTLTLNKTQEVKDEALEDTLIDLANYALLAVIELQCEKEE